MNPRLIDITGKKLGRWTVIGHEKMDPKSGRMLWKCKCDCGKEGLVNGVDLRKGHSKSCGCLAVDIARERSQTKDSGRNKLFRQYKKGSEYRGITFNLTDEQFNKITKSNCYYCGVEPSTISRKSSEFGIYIFNGIDRKNPRLGYEIDNCVPCCYDCNFLKRSRDFKFFINKIRRIYLNLEKNNFYGEIYQEYDEKDEPNPNDGIPGRPPKQVDLKKI